MRYARIITEAAGTYWALHPAKAEAAIAFLAFAAAGGKRTPDEVRSIVGFDPFDDDDDDETPAPVASEPETAIAVLGVKGIISARLSSEMNISGGGGTSAEGLGRRFDEAMRDPRISAVVLDVDSPGGSVFGVQEVAEKIRNARGAKPVVSVVNPFCASAAFWIASAADEIVITPSGECGSLGVYMYHESIARWLDKMGIDPTLIKAGEHKAEGLSAFKLEDGAREYQQSRVDDYYRAFVDGVAAGRRLESKVVAETFGKGRMFGAEQAVVIGMCDRVGTLEGELQRLKSAAAPVSAPVNGGAARRLAMR